MIIGGYLWAAVVLIAVIVSGVFLVRRVRRVRSPAREPVGPREHFAGALEDMRLRGTLTPGDLSAQTEAARLTGAAPPKLEGLPQTPEDRPERARGSAAGRRQDDQTHDRDRGERPPAEPGGPA